MGAGNTQGGLPPLPTCLAQADSGCALRGKWAAARHTQDGSRLRGMADLQVLVLGEGLHQGPVPGVGPTGRATHHMPGVARRRDTRKVVRSEAWQWGGYVEGSTGQAEGLASEVGAKKPTLGSQDPAGCAERDRAPTAPADCPEHWKAAPLARWVLGCLACPHPSRLRLCSSQERKKGTQAHSRGHGMLPDGSSHPRWVRGLGEAGPSTCLSRANLGTRAVHTPQHTISYSAALLAEKSIVLYKAQSLCF